MLVITRRTDDSIQIGDVIEITVLEVNGNTVKIGITAPREIEIQRSELYIKINRAAALKQRDSS